MLRADADTRKEWIRARRSKRKQAKQARVRRQGFRYFLLLAFLAAGACAFSMLPWSLRSADSDIVVRGNKVVSAEQVKNALASTIGVPLYRLDPKQLEHQVGTLKAVRFAFVRRYVLPRPKLVVEVLEEYPFASFAQDADSPITHVISQSGRMIPVAEFPSMGKPSLTIYGSANNLRLSAQQVSQWGSWIGYINDLTGQQVASVDMRTPQDVKVRAGDLCLKLGMPDQGLTRRLGRLSSVLASVGTLKGKLEYVDLGLDNNIPLKVAKRVEGQHAETASEAPPARL